MGIERIAMLLYQIGDIRMFYENDVRFLEQFKLSLYKFNSTSDQYVDSCIMTKDFKLGTKTNLWKDIIIPEVENVFFAAVQEWSDDFMEKFGMLI
jgi:hypothetical protein